MNPFLYSSFFLSSFIPYYYSFSLHSFFSFLFCYLILLFLLSLLSSLYMSSLLPSLFSSFRTAHFILIIPFVSSVPPLFTFFFYSFFLPLCVSYLSLLLLVLLSFPSLEPLRLPSPLVSLISLLFPLLLSSLSFPFSSLFSSRLSHFPSLPSSPLISLISLLFPHLLSSFSFPFFSFSLSLIPLLLLFPPLGLIMYSISQESSSMVVDTNIFICYFQ